MLPWTNRAGNFSPLKAATFALLWLPAAYLAIRWFSGGLGPRPVTEAIHQTGLWAIRFLLLSLAVTPVRKILRWNGLIAVRRMIGLSALFYALAHLLLYALDQKWMIAMIASEIALRIYLTIGFVALLGLGVLGATSTDAAIRRLGRSWNRLHKIVYAIGVLAVLHFFMQTKADVYEATLMAGLFALLMGYRIAERRGLPLQSPLVLLGVAIAAALATVAIEYAWYALATGIPPARVLAANLHFAFSIRPAWWVLAIGGSVAAAGWARSLAGGAPQTRPKRAVA
ncbi:MAG: sulfoxide reductase heme-binding subunit YedZ [Rhizobiaceae bacterium]|nr:sulfoxide reductase heme-binding subunit YedZ [Rhizobiaceae bacterium]